VQQLTNQEFHAVYAGRAEAKQPVTRIEGRGRHPDAAGRVAAALQVGASAPWQRDDKDSIVTVIVGQDQVPRAQTDGPT
jgi:uncharacterized Ntn-hydrolase superfamily protein